VNAFVAVLSATPAWAQGDQRATAVLGLEARTGRGGEIDTAKAVLTSTKVIDAAAADVLGEGVAWRDVARVELLPAGRSSVMLSVTGTDADAVEAGVAERLLDAIAREAILSMNTERDDPASELNEKQAELAEKQAEHSRIVAKLERSTRALRGRGLLDIELQAGQKRQQLIGSAARLEAVREAIDAATGEGSPAADRLAALAQLVSSRGRVVELADSPLAKAEAEAALAEARARLAEARTFKGLPADSPYRQPFTELAQLGITVSTLRAEIEALERQKEAEPAVAASEVAELTAPRAMLQSEVRQLQFEINDLQRNAQAQRGGAARLVLLTPGRNDPTTRPGR